VTTGAKDGQGYIARLSSDGRILANPWVGGLHGPKGMALVGGKLYVSSMDEVVEIDVERGAIAHRYPVEGAKELNDVAADADARSTSPTPEKPSTSSSCSRAGRPASSSILAISRAPTESIVMAPGCCGRQGRRVLAVDRASKAVTVLFDRIGYVDGLEKISESQFLISDWKGTVRLLQTGRPAVKLLETYPANINAADLGWIVAEKMMLVPTFLDNRVVAYRLRD